jgi:photosystem I subunit V
MASTVQMKTFVGQRASLASKVGNISMRVFFRSGGVWNEYMPRAARCKPEYASASFPCLQYVISTMNLRRILILSQPSLNVTRLTLHNQLNPCHHWPFVQVQRATVMKPVARTRLVTKAISDTNLVVGGCTVAALALGRFVFLPAHRAALAKAGMPKQNGVTHFEAGDRLAEEMSGLLKTNDPAGFNIVDVFAWGALGHAAAFYILVSMYAYIYIYIYI